MKLTLKQVRSLSTWGLVGCATLALSSALGLFLFGLSALPVLAVIFSVGFDLGSLFMLVHVGTYVVPALLRYLDD